MQALTDDQLLQQFRDGQTDAFDLLFERYNRAVYAFALSMLRDPSAAEEILQETFLSVARSAKNYDSRGRFRAWLMRMVRNRCLNWIQSRRVRQAAFRAGGLEGVAPTAATPPPHRRLEETEQREAIEQAIAQLPPRQREAIVLYAYQQMSYQQVAEVLEAPLNTVKTLIHRARAGLAEALAHEEGEFNRVL